MKSWLDELSNKESIRLDRKVKYQCMMDDPVEGEQDEVTMIPSSIDNWVNSKDNF